MDTATRKRLLAALNEHKGAISDDWYHALAGTTWIDLDRDEVRRRLSNLVGQAITAMMAEPFDHDGARSVGDGLAQLFTFQAKGVGRSIGALSSGFGGNLTGEDAAALEPVLGWLVQDVASGFVERVSAMVVDEQEQTRQALLNREVNAGQASRLTHTQLEARVEERTRELARINSELLREIDERKLAERALRESEARFRNLVESVSDIIYSADAEGRLTYVSPAVEQSLGYRPEELTGASPLRYVHEPDRPRVGESVGLLLQGQTVQNEYRIVTKSGALRWMSTSSEPICLDGQVVGFRGVLADINDRKEAEEALRESEARWRSLVDHAPDLVLTVDRQGRILFINQMFDLFGRTPEEVLGQVAANFAVPEHREAVADLIEDVFTTGQGCSFEAPTLSIDGRILWFHTRVGPIVQGGEVSAVMLITRDITESKQMGDYKDNIVRDVSHELRTPLAKMQMSLELLLEKLDDSAFDRHKAIRLGEQAFRSVERLLGTVEAILDLSSLEAGVQPYHMGDVAIEDLIYDALKDMEVLAEARGLDLVANVAPGLPEIQGDSDKLYRVFMNLLDNAIKFSDEGEIGLSAKRKDDAVVICVSDSGRGISAENVGRVFERFYQERAGSQGIGVGLSICESIVAAHGGRIWAESGGRGEGSAFHVVLPISGSGE